MKSIICLLVLALCAIALADSQGKWVLQAQTEFKHSGPDSYQFCVPVGVRTKTDNAFISMQVVFEETFRFMTVDFDFNGKGEDHIENVETNIVTFMLSDYQGKTYSNWNNLAIANGTLTGTIRSDKKPLKIIISVAVNKAKELETVPRAAEKCERFYAAQDVTTTETTGAVARMHTGIVFFIFSAFGSFFLTLSCCLCCFLIVRRRKMKLARRTIATHSDEEMQENMYPGQISQIQSQQEMRKEEPAQQVPQPIFYIAPQVEGQQPYYMPASQFYPMMQPQYIQFVPAPQQ